MASVVTSCPYLVLHRFILRRPCAAASSFHFPLLPAKQSFLHPLTTTPFIPSSRFTTSSLFSSPAPERSLQHHFPNEVALLENVTTESKPEANDEAIISEAKVRNSVPIEIRPPPILSVKEKKELGSYAHSLGKNLKSQQVGKSGITGTVVGALIETLEANELLKLKIHNSCPGEFEEVLKQLEECTGSVVVGRIGRTVILYRPSLTKMKAEEEKKKRAQIILAKKQAAAKQFPQGRRTPPPLQGQKLRNSGRGLRGKSRFRAIDG